MKKYSFFVVLFVSIKTLCAQTLPYPFEAIEIFDLPEISTVSNKVKVENVYDYKYGRNGIKDSSLIYSINYYYNLDGNLSELRHSYPDSSRASITEYIYNTLGLLIKQNYKSRMSGSRYPKSQFYITTHEFEYDTLKRPIYKYAYNEDTTSLVISKYVYNLAGRLEKIFKKANKADYTLDYTIVYNEEGRVTAVNRMIEKNKIDFSYLYEYPDNDEVLKFFKTDRKAKPYEEYKYNSANQLIKSVYYSLNGEDIFNTKNIYNDDGTLFSQFRYVNITLTETNRHYYQK